MLMLYSSAIRRFGTCSRRLTKIDWRKEFESLHIDDVKPLPKLRTVEISAQVIKPTRGIEINQNKSPLILIHGLFGAKQNYASVGKQISSLTQREVIGLDMRNHGASPHAAPHTYMAMARDTIEYLEKHVRVPVALAGHSMGAKVSMLVALLRPELIEKLVVIDNSPASEKLDQQFYRGLLGLCHLERDKSLPGLPKTALHAKMDKILLKYEKDKLVRLFLLSNLCKRTTKHDSSPIKFRVPVLNFLKDDVLRELGLWPEDVKGKKFHGPVKVMKAAESNFIQEHNISEDFPHYFDSFDVSVYECGHWLVSEKPEQFVKEMIEFLDDSSHAQ
ncbi:uncharacterized protein CXQ87_000969 [Candidozyma duobushaemuli]|uniref:AB hydrolase-1 domain-containing protein n=2 Tax=Candidozyma TaxID=3303203 RepID=A0ABX8I0F4_9ASCO|nr:uncharacterized protein CXQ87_000969 [[Candida] duobushaemulonis]PVH18056.1 hypothetical protein CXQ87_000969 [[Candida] duobushaemulonis]QWU86625.1 hypothetical protein CA3LBN_000843 [[Candida] haemuloni]